MYNNKSYGIRQYIELIYCHEMSLRKPQLDEQTPLKTQLQYDYQVQDDYKVL
jgi:hypothetical protein